MSEDVFYLYERTSRYYHSCAKTKTDCQSECYCHLQQTVIPSAIGDPFIPCNLQRKCYIKPGEMCSICLDPIIKKSNAFITWCGHPFHKKCLFMYMQSKWSSINPMHPVKCPMCRRMLGHPIFSQRYRSSYFNVWHKDDNELDKLEDYELCGEYATPVYCGNGYDHYLLTKSDCESCQLYREKGDSLYN